MDHETIGAWRALLGAHASLTSQIERELAASGLPPLGWYDVLWPLYEADGRRLRMSALAAEVTISRTGLTRLVDRIEGAGLIRREPVPEDRRGSYVVLAPAGVRMLRRMWPVYEAALERWFAPNVGDARRLRRALERLVVSDGGHQQ